MFSTKLLQAIGSFLYGIRWLLIVLLAIGIPLYLYLATSDEPVFAPAQDVELGRTSAESIAQDPDEYPLLPEAEYPEAYRHLRRVVKGIIDSPDIQYRELFAYDQMKIINRDDVLNAFCTPGGYIYAYTGLIKYLDQEDHLAGVLGHEIGHAEKRHSSVRLQQEFGTKALTSFILLTLPISTRDYVNAKILKDLMCRTARLQHETRRPISVEGVSAKPAADQRGARRSRVTDRSQPSPSRERASSGVDSGT